MSAVSAANPGIASLSQLLSSAGSATLNSALSTPAVQSALQSAPAGDIVQLSDQAIQLQEAASLFGLPASSSTAASPDSLLLQALNSSLTGSTAAPSTAAASSTAAAAATTTASLALQQVSELFGTNANSSNGSLSILG